LVTLPATPSATLSATPTVSDTPGSTAPGPPCLSPGIAAVGLIGFLLFKRAEQSRIDVRELKE
jgi:hypothetical protein